MGGERYEIAVMCVVRVSKGRLKLWEGVEDVGAVKEIFCCQNMDDLIQVCMW